MAANKMTEKISISFSQFQRELILKYGYPWDEIQKQLKRVQNNKNDITITSTYFEWEHLAGDLSRSINHDEVPSKFIEEVDEIADIVENYL